jgi:hypothetical protein
MAAHRPFGSVNRRWCEPAPALPEHRRQLRKVHPARVAYLGRLHAL